MEGTLPRDTENETKQQTQYLLVIYQSMARLSISYSWTQMQETCCTQNNYSKPNTCFYYAWEWLDSPLAKFSCKRRKTTAHTKFHLTLGEPQIPGKEGTTGHQIQYMLVIPCTGIAISF